MNQKPIITLTAQDKGSSSWNIKLPAKRPAPEPLAKSWLWPDHIAGKRETRRLREEHNALVNSHAALVTELQNQLENIEGDIEAAKQSPDDWPHLPAETSEARAASIRVALQAANPSA